MFGANLGETLFYSWIQMMSKITKKLTHYCLQEHIKPTVKILKIGTPEIITIIVLRLEQLDFTVQYCVQKMQTE